MIKASDLMTYFQSKF